MIGELNNTFFTHYGKYFSSQHSKKNAAIPFKDHPHLSILVDVLCRKINHHLILHPEFSSRMYEVLIEALLLNLSQENVLYTLQNAPLIYFDTARLSAIEHEKKSIEKDFHDLKHKLDFADKNLLIVLTDAGLFLNKHKDDDSFLYYQFEKLLHHPNCRFIIFSETTLYLHNHRHLNQLFTYLTIAGPNESDIATLLKQQRTELENFHHVLIPEELLSLAYSLSERYLSTSDTLEKTLLLLDSSAARTVAAERVENSNHFKPVLTAATLINVLSSWTQIPPTHLQLNKFKLSEFTQGMQQRIFGQDAAISMLGQGLQQAQAHLQYNTGPFCSLLFTGPEHSGKRTTALALAEQLFKQLQVLYIAQITSKQTSIFTIKFQRCTDKQYLSLQNIVQQTPHAMIMLENIDQGASTLFDELQEILSTGLLHDDHGNQFNFRQSIFILSTTLAAHHLTTLAKTMGADNENDIEPVDLMQLIMNEQKHETLCAGNHYSPQEIADEIAPDITGYLPASLCEHLHIVPFLPLNKAAVEQIIRLKFKLLGKVLDSRYGVELGYAPEVIRYLASEVLIKQDINDQVIDIDKALKQLYFVIEQAILSQADNKNRPHQLFLQLNETGQILRCDWLHLTATRQHAT